MIFFWSWTCATQKKREDQKIWQSVLNVMCPRHLDHGLKSRKKRQVSKKRTQKLTKCQHWCFSDTWRFRHLVIFLLLSLDTCLFFLDFNPWFTSVVNPLTFKNTCDFYNAKQKLPSVWDLTFFRHLAIQTFDKGFSLDTCVFFTSRFQSKCNLNTWRFRRSIWRTLKKITSI